MTACAPGRRCSVPPFCDRRTSDHALVTAGEEQDGARTAPAGRAPAETAEPVVSGGLAEPVGRVAGVPAAGVFGLVKAIGTVHPGHRRAASGAGRATRRRSRSVIIITASAWPRRAFSRVVYCPM